MGKLTFVLHDESVNTYGFRDAHQRSQFGRSLKKNPVMLPESR